MRFQPVAVFLLASTVAGCNLHGKPAVERKDRAVGPAGPAATETVEPSNVVAPGIVEPWDAQINLSAQESGRIAEILIEEGDFVRTGQVLATLDESAQRHGVELARADVEEAEAALASIESGTTAEELAQAQADSEAAAAQDELARIAAARMAQLHAEEVVSDDAFDRAAAEARTRTAAARRAAARLAELKRGARLEDRRAAEARVSAARARLRVAEDSLARRRVRAVGDGTVLLSRFHAGEYYSPAAGALFVLGDITRLQVRLEVDEIDAAVPAPGAVCAIYSDAGVRLTEGTIVRLAPKLGRRALPLESPTARADIRVREVFVEVPATSNLIPNQRVWGHVERAVAAAAG
jgi:multidrug resistance efflux pump